MTCREAIDVSPTISTAHAGPIRRRAAPGLPDADRRRAGAYASAAPELGRRDRPVAPWR